MLELCDMLQQLLHNECPPLANAPLSLWQPRADACGTVSSWANSSLTNNKQRQKQGERERERAAKSREKPAQLTKEPLLGAEGEKGLTITINSVSVVTHTHTHAEIQTHTLLVLCLSFATIWVEFQVCSILYGEFSANISS